MRTERLEPSANRSRCAYKGSAAYWHVRVGDRVEPDLVWAYPVPEREVEPIRDHFCFFNERVDVELDGQIRLSARSRSGAAARARRRARRRCAG